MHFLVLIVKFLKISISTVVVKSITSRGPSIWTPLKITGARTGSSTVMYQTLPLLTVCPMCEESLASENNLCMR